MGPVNSRKRCRRRSLHALTLLFSHRGGQHLITAAAAADVNAEPFDFLIERGKGNQKTLGGLSLVPVGALQHVNDDAALDLVHDLEESWLRIVRRGPRTGFARERRQKFRKL